MKPIRILMLEDNPMDVAAIQKTLSCLCFPIDLTLTRTAGEYTAKLREGTYDLILSDYQLPNFDAVKALKARNETRRDTPFILITGAVSEEVAILVLKEGADDYILKDRLQHLPQAVEKILVKQKNGRAESLPATASSELTDRFQLAARASFDIIWDYDVEKDRVYCSRAIEKIIGSCSEENFKPLFLKQFIHPDDLTAMKKSFLLAVSGKENRWRKIFRVRRRDGSLAWININALVLRDNRDKALRFTGVAHDVTEVRRLQHQLVQLELKTQRQIAEITLQAQERERMQIGRELHDNVNQILATAKIMIDTARNFPEMREVCLYKSQEAIIEAINELRNLAHSMMPPALEDTDFEQILCELAHDINLAGVTNLKLSLPPLGELQQMSDQIKLCFYRIIQEQVSNILKYAKASNVIIRIETGEDSFSLRIEDDGCGFDPESQPKGIGLKNIASRCQLLGGTMELETAPGAGCCILVKVPVHGEVNSA
jgi:two-component system sensor histidine kinase UhpB